MRQMDGRDLCSRSGRIARSRDQRGDACDHAEHAGHGVDDVHGVFEPTPLPSLLTCDLEAPLKVARVADQSREFLQLVERRGLKPGCALRVESRDEAADTVELRLEGGEPLSLGYRAASKILVEGV